LNQFETAALYVHTWARSWASAMHDGQGQTTTEYALLIGVLAIFVIGGTEAIRLAFSGFFHSLGDAPATPRP
jgi:Flp pilus assembly pilin Flp